MRCNIAAAFLHNPEIVYLDEPTIGLDSESKESIRKCILDINEEAKTTFIVTSHDFQDIETLCRRIMVISQGNIILDDMMANVRQEFNKEKKIRVEMAENPWFQKETFSCLERKKFSRRRIVLWWSMMWQKQRVFPFCRSGKEDRNSGCRNQFQRY